MEDNALSIGISLQALSVLIYRDNFIRTEKSYTEVLVYLGKEYEVNNLLLLSSTRNTVTGSPALQSTPACMKTTSMRATVIHSP